MSVEHGFIYGFTIATLTTLDILTAFAPLPKVASLPSDLAGINEDHHEITELPIIAIAAINSIMLLGLIIVRRTIIINEFINTFELSSIA